jgi:hypothetical protein
MFGKGEVLIVDIGVEPTGFAGGLQRVKLGSG